MKSLKCIGIVYFKWLINMKTGQEQWIHCPEVCCPWVEQSSGRTGLWASYCRGAEKAEYFSCYQNDNHICGCYPCTSGSVASIDRISLFVSGMVGKRGLRDVAAVWDDLDSNACLGERSCLELTYRTIVILNSCKISNIMKLAECTSNPTPMCRLCNKYSGVR